MSLCKRLAVPGPEWELTCKLSGYTLGKWFYEIDHSGSELTEMQSMQLLSTQPLKPLHQDFASLPICTPFVQSPLVNFFW